MLAARLFGRFLRGRFLIKIFAIRIGRLNGLLCLTGRVFVIEPYFRWVYYWWKGARAPIIKKYTGPRGPYLSGGIPHAN